MSAATGIVAAGNWIVDKTKIIDTYPTQDSLASIEIEERNNGGGPFNVLCDLAKLGAAFPLQGLGLIGADAEGDWILDHCQRLGIDTSLLSRHDSAPTSYSDVMTVRSSGRRTFFHQPGANRHLGAGHFDWRKMHSRILYLGYLGLLDTLDAPEPRHGTIAAALLHEAGRQGFLRVADLVSTERADYARIVTPALPEIDILICNEVEATRITRHATRDSSERHLETGLRDAAQAFLLGGVSRWAVIHLPEGAYARSAAGEEIWQGRVDLARDQIVGAAGAGDAFAAGLLFGIHEEWTIAQSLRLGVCTAAASLRSASTSGGISSAAESLSLGDTSGYLAFP